jgi:hypothetical protein
VPAIFISAADKMLTRVGAILPGVAAFSGKSSVMTQQTVKHNPALA